MNKVVNKYKNNTLYELRSSNYLEHAFGDNSGYGRSWKNHKYVARIRVGHRYRYFYSLEEYEKYIENLRTSSKDGEKEFQKLLTENRIEVNDENNLDIDPEDIPLSLARSKAQITQKKYKHVSANPFSSKEEKQKAHNEFNKAMSDLEKSAHGRRSNY